MESNGISGSGVSAVDAGGVCVHRDTMFDEELEKTLNENLEQLLNKSLDFRSISQESSTSFSTSANTNPNFYTKIAVKSDLNITFLLSIFDNIVGPRCIHFWSKHQQQQDELDQYLLKYIAVHTLNGELYNQEKLIDNHKYRFYLINEIDYAILGIFFNANTVNTMSFSSGYKLSSLQSITGSSAASSSSNYNTQLNCLAIIVPLEFKAILLDNSQFFMSAFDNYILEFKVFAEIADKVNNVTRAIHDLTKFINEFCVNFDMLQTRGLKTVNLRDTHFLETELTIDRDFLICCITSHILTNMNSIVIGQSSTSINKMISTLAFFLPKDKQLLSCFAFLEATQLCGYLNIQGVVNENTNNLNDILNADLLLNKSTPTTVIDLNTRQVYRTNLLDDFAFMKESYANTKIKMFYNKHERRELLKLWNIETIIYNCIRSKSTLIADMLKQVECLDTRHGLRESFLNLYVKELNTIALTLIEFIEKEISHTCKNKDRILSISTRKLLKDLDFKNEEDLHVALSYADNLKSNFSKTFQLTKS